MRYRTKPAIVEAFQWGAATLSPAWLTERLAEPDPYEGANCLSMNQCAIMGPDLAVSQSDGIKYAPPGYWIVKGTRGELYVVDPATFAAGFEAV